MFSLAGLLFLADLVSLVQLPTAVEYLLAGIATTMLAILVQVAVAIAQSSLG